MKRNVTAWTVLVAALGVPFIARAAEDGLLRTSARPAYVYRGEERMLAIPYSTNVWEYPEKRIERAPGIPTVLDTNVVHEFEFRPREGSAPARPDLVSVSANGRRIFHESLCVVHQRRMRRQPIGNPTRSALSPRSGMAGLLNASPTFFPHVDPGLTGGCFMARNGPVLGYVCSDCTAALLAWCDRREPPQAVLPHQTPYDANPHLREVYLRAFGNGFVDQWSEDARLPVFGPTTADEKAQTFGYSDGVVEARRARKKP